MLTLVEGNRGRPGLGPLIGSTVAYLTAGILSACGSSSAPAPLAFSPLSEEVLNCSNPLPVSVVNESLTDDIPQDLDPLRDPAPQTTLYFTVMLPKRCPGDHFPLVIQSPGFGSSRLTAVATSGDLYSTDPSFSSINELAQALPYHNYVLISLDTRGLGESQPPNGGGYARIIDPKAETQDGKALIDWAYDHSDEFFIQRQPGTGIAKDINVGLLGYSYGGGFQLPLAALDPRVDAMVPVAAWHDLLYSLIPGDVLKQSWLQILCLFAVTPSSGAVIGAYDTPLQDTTCNVLAIRDPAAFDIHTLDDLTTITSSAAAIPEAVTQEQLLDFFYSHGMGYFRNQQQAGQPWGYGESQAKLRPVPTLFIQGNRDNLFNLTDAYWNWRYFRAAGGDVRLMSMEGGHMNPVAEQVEGTANCGGVLGVNSALAWFDHFLQGTTTSDFNSIPGAVCISVAATQGAPNVPAIGVELPGMPIGSLSGIGAFPAMLPQLNVSVSATSITPVFVPIVTISGNDKVLAGIPTLNQLSVTAGTAAVHTATALIGVGIMRGASTFLVDDQLTPFVAGSPTDNIHVDEGDPIFLPAVGEVLQDGDQVGLLFYQEQVQYATIVSAPGLEGSPGVVSLINGQTLPTPITSILNPIQNIGVDPNPYTVTAAGVALPILVPGTYPGSRLTTP